MAATLELSHTGPSSDVEVLSEREDGPNSKRLRAEEEHVGTEFTGPYPSSWVHTIQNAARKAANFNRQLLYNRQHTRGACYDAHSQQTHLPEAQVMRLPPEKTQVGNHPAQLMPHQYVDGYIVYSAHAIMNAYEGNFEDHLPPTTSQSTIPRTSSAQRTDKQPQRQTQTTAAKEGRDSSRAASEEPKGPGRKRKPTCSICIGTEERNKLGEPEPFVQCATCNGRVHPSCIDIDPQLVPIIKTYDWQCVDCKLCIVCKDPGSENKFLFCDECDRGYHTFCIGLKNIPSGRWICDKCGQCASCGKTSPGEGNAKWRHEYSRAKEGEEPKFLQTLCMACSKQFRIGNFCPVCLKVYRATENDLPMVCCDKCDRWIHIGCDNIDEATYEEMAESTQSYICCLCRGEVADRS
eukprot:comp54223_c0_seq1/m.47747 comp54223_c0_seq1/g.47747  ORF comp54223_c0_seq1/g.47747 comp54223_c0_seq1/m.47747 type:complete len:407 (-) comp54223_c0_seq1:570-1790(-)